MSYAVHMQTHWHILFKNSPFTTLKKNFHRKYIPK